MLSAIEDELLACDKFQISVAFITMSGVEPLLPTLKELEKLHKSKNIRLKMYDVNASKEGFHTKGYIFKSKEIYRIIIGSSNITSAALTKNREWNTKIVSTESGEVAEQILAEYHQL